MEALDWLVLILTLAAIVGYGAWKTRKNNTLDGYLKGGNSMRWSTIGLSIMATQASAITFLSTPGQAYEDGMGFIQFYFGLPIAMVLVSAFFIPNYYKLNVFTAYEYLEKRFDQRIRLFTAFLFLVSRGLAAGITIYAPAIILSTILGWNLNLMNVAVGTLVIVYTVSGGTKAVSLTQKWQMAVIFTGMIIAFVYMVSGIPEQVSFMDSIEIAGVLGKMEIVDTSIDFSNRYTLVSGLTGGLFLSLSYFGTDQSQVQRYLGGKSLQESRLGLMFNGLLKVPMQFFILLIGIMLFVFYQFQAPPAFFNQQGLAAVKASAEGKNITQLESEFHLVHEEKKELLTAYTGSSETERKSIEPQIQALQIEQRAIRSDIKKEIERIDDRIETKDSDYIFLTFVLKYLPHGLIGLLLAVIFSAAMSSTAGELNALASTTMVDYVQTLSSKTFTDLEQVRISKWITVAWGVAAIGIALSASLFDNLIQLVNILGSLFYGTILGIFLTAFFLKRIQAFAILIAAFIAEATVLFIHLGVTLEWFKFSYLMYNVIGCLAVVLLAILIQFFSRERIVNTN